MILPVDFEAGDLLPGQAGRHAEREKPVEIMRQPQQLAEPQTDDRGVVGTHHEVATDAHPPVIPELEVGTDMEGGQLQQVADEKGRTRGAVDEMAGEKADPQDRPHLIMWQRLNVDEPALAQVASHERRLAGFRFDQFETGGVIGRIGVFLEHGDDEFPEQGDERRVDADGLVGLWFGHGVKAEAGFG